MSYEDLVADFVGDDVHLDNPGLRLHNPHFDERIKHPSVNGRNMLDWQHESAVTDFGIQFIGSHYSNLDWLVEEEDRIRNGRQQRESVFDKRLSRLGIKARFRLGNCALGYIPERKSTSGPFLVPQIKYLRPKKMDEYSTSGTTVVFTLGRPSLDFHLYGTGRTISRFADAVDAGPLSLPNGPRVIPLPHPGPQGIMHYLKSRNATALDEKAQDDAFGQLVNKHLQNLSLPLISW